MREAEIPHPLEETKKNYAKSEKGNNVRVKKKKRSKGGYDENTNTNMERPGMVGTI